jgi:protein phosphatase
MEYKYSFYCDQGKRSNNQDACYVAENGNNQLLAIVCDGVGSEKHSEIASQSMVTTCANNFINFKDSDFKSFYVPSLKEARNTIVKTIEEEYSGKSSSTTVVCCMINKNKLSVAWLGDSRLYHYSKLTKE